MELHRISASDRAPVSDAAVLSKAVVRAARLLELTQRDVSVALGISQATTSRLFAGKYLLSQDRAKEWELARLLVRMFRSLDALWGHEESARLWLGSDNLALGARPKDLLRSVEGMVRVVTYLDAARGRL
ncbi:MAG: XRE family transcriptional regulator [Betaproteobacteria bacterium]|nr:XRE family transcriptional regulator [Betaproteobacteria bacterium]